MTDQVSDMAWAPINKLVNSLTPYFSVSQQALTGVSLYPDFRNPRTIRDKGEVFSSTFGAVDEYKRLAGSQLESHMLNHG